MLSNITNQINSLTDIKDVNKIIQECEKQKKHICNEKWEKHYKDSTDNDSYITLPKLLEEFHLHNCHLNDSYAVFNDLESYVYEGNISLSTILMRAECLNMDVPPSVAKMVCSRCVCHHCPYQEECNGYTCKTCKPHYLGYQWICEE